MPTLNMDPRIVIVGFMGCGKTTVAKALSAALKCEMIDLDSLISEQENMSVPDLIKERGESGFRDSESFALRAALERSAVRIIALGGGAWTLDRNRDLIKQHGCVTIFLDASYNLCWQRICAHSAPRPLALDRPAAHKLYRERYPLYALADIRIEINEQMSAADVAAQIVRDLKRWRPVV
jgi:shikimate kinase